MSKEKAKKYLKVLAILFIVLGIIMLSVGFYKKNSYKNPDSEFSYSKTSINAYVGGDAYNYIINGTYFTAYAVMGTGCFIISAITGTAALFLSIRPDEEKIPEL